MFSIFNKIGWYLKKHWFRYLLAILLLNLASIISVLPPKVLEEGINQIINKTITEESLLKLIIYMFILMVIGYIVSFTWIYLLYGSGNDLEYTIRKNFFRHLLKMDNKFFERHVIGDLMARATSDLRAVATTASYGILALVDSTFYLIFILFMMIFTIDLKLTLFALIPLPFVVIGVKLLGDRIHKSFTEYQNTFSDLNNKVLESVSGVRVIRAYVQENKDIERLSDSAKESSNKNIAITKVDALFDPLFKTAFSISYLITFGYGTYLVFKQQLTPGELVSFSIYLGMLGWPMFALGDTVNVMQRGNASYDRINHILNEESEVKEPNEPIDISRFEKLSINNISFSYPYSNRLILSNINIELHKGKTLGIVGKTGSGKTTLIKHIMKQYDLKIGKILLNGMDYTDISTKTIRSFFGYVPQEHILFSGTVKENIAIGKELATDDQIEYAIDMAAFRKDLSFLDNGVDTVVGEQGVMLSGGQKQRLSIARAFVLDPEVLILDDSLSAVDGTTEKMILKHIKEHRQNKTTIIVAHRLSAVEHADEIIVLDHGVIIERGTHEELMLQPGWYSNQYRHQQMKRGGE